MLRFTEEAFQRARWWAQDALDTEPWLDFDFALEAAESLEEYGYARIREGLSPEQVTCCYYNGEPLTDGTIWWTPLPPEATIFGARGRLIGALEYIPDDEEE